MQLCCAEVIVRCSQGFLSLGSGVQCTFIIYRCTICNAFYFIEVKMYPNLGCTSCKSITLKNPVAAQNYCHYDVLSRVTTPYVFLSLKKLGRLYWALPKQRRQPEIFQGKVNNKFEHIKKEVRFY